jgi:hypothetical protein
VVGNAKVGPVPFLESRTAMPTSTGATSTQEPPLLLKVLFRHATSTQASPLLL